MARISGVDLPKKKSVLFGLQYIYGIGPAIAADILEKAEVDPALKVGDLSEENVGWYKNRAVCIDFGDLSHGKM